MEGPSIVILLDEVKKFKGKRIADASGNWKNIAEHMLEGEKIIDFKSWGKHFIVCFRTFSIRIHFLMFGSYRIDEKKDGKPRLHLGFKNGELNFYNCSVQYIEGNINSVYDWKADVLSDTWSTKKGMAKLRDLQDEMVCDALLDQTIFSGVGNIIKNEVLFRIYVHPESKIQCLPKRKLRELVAEARNYSFDFLKWKRKYELKKHWLIYGKSICPRCDIKIQKMQTGSRKRRSFYCTNCQIKYEKELILTKRL